MNPSPPSEARTRLTMRRLLMAVITIGMIETAADLALLEHYDGAWQLPPLVLIGFALLVVAWITVKGGPLAVVMMRTMMVCLWRYVVID